MSEPEFNPRASAGASRQSALPKTWVIAAVGGLVLISLFKPEWLEVLSKDGAGKKAQPGQVTSEEPSPGADSGKQLTPEPQPAPQIAPGPRSSAQTTVAEREPKREATPPKKPEPAQTGSRDKTATPKPKEFLKEISPGVLQSPAGLVYGKGSAQGNRLDHVMEHASDDPSKPTHGVFEGSRDEILALLDEAWEASQTRGPPEVKKEEQGRRTVYTVNLRRKVGYGGGQSGARKNHPPLTGIRLVLEGRNVITAFPLSP